MLGLDSKKSTHKVYDEKKSKSESDRNSENSSEDENNEDDNKSTNQENLEEFEKNDNVEKFFRVEPNLKDLFSSNDVFKFKFTDENEVKSDNEESDYIVDKSDFRNNPLLGEFGFEKLKRFHYSSSETEEDEEEDNNDVENEIYEVKNEKRVQNLNENKSFLPNFDTDSQLNDALKFFSRPKDFDIENIRKEWLVKREILVKVNYI